MVFSLLTSNDLPLHMGTGKSAKGKSSVWSHLVSECPAFLSQLKFQLNLQKANMSSKPVTFIDLIRSILQRKRRHSLMSKTSIPWTIGRGMFAAKQKGIPCIHASRELEEIFGMKCTPASYKIKTVIRNITHSPSRKIEKHPSGKLHFLKGKIIT